MNDGDSPSRRYAREYAAAAITGVLEMSDYDARMMPWSKSEHATVMTEVAELRDQLLRRWNSKNL